MDELCDHTDVLVVGGGPGGYSAAFRAADLGLDVTIVTDEARLGGVCLLRGCIPSKALLEATELIGRARAARQFGLGFGDPEIDLDTLRQWVEGVVEQLTDGLGTISDRRKVHVVQGRATFEGSSTVRVSTDDEDATIEFDHAVIATGSRPIPLPDVPFGERIMDSARALTLPDVPERLLVVGGGYVGLELGTVYAALGSTVTLVEMTDRLIPMVDDDLVRPLARQLEQHFESVFLETTVAQLTESDGEVHARLEGGDSLDEATFDRVLVAIGRRPNSEELGLEHTDVDVDDDGFIIVDDERRTTDDRIFAIGDVVGGHLLAHEAMHEGRVAAEVIGGEPAAFDARAVPAVIYTDPQIAWCGITEQQLQDHEGEVDILRYPWRASGRALTLGGTDGMTKLITETDTGRILGAGIVGRHAETMIAEAVLAIEMGAVARDLALAIAPHPTLSETLHEGAELQFGQPSHLPPDRGSDD